MRNENIEINATSESEQQVPVENANLLNLNIGSGDNLEKMIDSIKDYARCIPTGYKDIDNALQGGIRTGITIFAAKPNIGKTTMGLQLAEQFSSFGHQVLYFCNDMATVELISKGISRHSYINDKKNGYSVSEILNVHADSAIKSSEVFKKACNSYRENAKNLRIVDSSESLDINNIQKVIADYLKVGIKPIIFIDYLQKIVVPGIANDKEKMDYLIVLLKQIALCYSLPIVVISTVNRFSYDKELTLDSLKESGGLEYNADVILGLQYEGVGTGDFNINDAKKGAIWNMELVVLKQRLGGSDIKIPLKFYPKYNLFPYYPLETEKKKGKKTSDYKLF
ncbi:DnaB-like helicase C-terminal domain-containing protein [Schinkia azotoformans]|uniref:DnaB-like helicase C-terminal domain-containing protein n=1 Tax=Schinkia azotoformans TaxID=1454 RepID=UPI002DC01C73|nr:DnaB-like helicase C-terminal domain-containing protein [Schinkia azotoformans]MEC1717797.1 DnaB-like helicase C-terminal domain-containing protein [Schinkia azotoformans]MEC1743571.1 DnaB-like helicase C-terminal domain-containing protein [Schinkia azotoformans]MEC1746555.1 DnaB-like helicase C-terminal domain-containing protein [Schinkia azotoformans]MEC1757801.1 DnaB-like helicase C-terminal domain-containing protein [Schinkia azotoformans]MEC1769304.1 DnaB-like helicase C-terminal domai